MVVSLIQLVFFQIQHKSQRITKTKSYGNNLRYTNNNVQRNMGKVTCSPKHTSTVNNTFTKKYTTEQLQRK